MYKVVFKNDNELIVNVFSTLIDAEKELLDKLKKILDNVTLL